MATIGKVKIGQATRSTIVAQNFAPKPNVSLSEINNVDTSGVQDGYTIVYNSTQGKYLVQAAANLTGQMTQITGGTF